MTPQKLVIDADPGVGDALAIAMALADPQLDVVAVTGVGGRVSAAQVARNLSALVEALDPPKHPRLGVVDSPDTAYEWARFSELHGDDADVIRRLQGERGLGEWPVGDAPRHHPRSAVKLLLELSREVGSEAQLVTLGPLTNLALASELDPEFLGRWQQIVCLAGTFDGPGDVTAAAEFNVAFQPDAARKIFRSAARIVTVPVDLGARAILTFSQAQKLEWRPGHLASDFLGSLVPFALRTQHQWLGVEGYPLSEAAAIAAVSQPRLFHRQALAMDIETDGRLTRGMTVYDRRPRSPHRPNVHVLTAVEGQSLIDYAVTQLRRAALGSTGSQ